MIKVTRLNAVTSWNRALNAARRTVGKSALKKEPSDSWKAKMLLAEHSPIRLVEYEWTWEQIPQWVTVHFTRHHIGCESLFILNDQTVPVHKFPEESTCKEN